MEKKGRYQHTSEKGRQRESETETERERVERDDTDGPDSSSYAADPLKYIPNHRIAQL